MELSVPFMLGGIAVCFLVLVLMLIFAICRNKKARKADTRAGLADLLVYSSMIEDGILLCKNGAFMAAWMYSARDQESSSDDELVNDSTLLNNILREFGDGWMFHIDAVRQPSERYIQKGQSRFSHWLPALADEERRRFFEKQGDLYEGYFVLSVTFLPPLLAQTKFVELMYEDQGEKITASVRGQKLLEGFKKDLTHLESRLSAVFKLSRLKSFTVQNEDGSLQYYDNFLSHLQFCITGKRHPVSLPACPVYLDAVLGGQEFYGGIIPKIGDNFIEVVAIEGFPSESYPGILSALADLNVQYRWSSRWIALDSYTAESHIEKYRRKWRQKQRGIIDQIFHLNGPVDTDAVMMTEDAETAISEVKSNQVAAGYYTSVIVLMDPQMDVLERNALKLDKQIRNLGFSSRIETVNTMDAFFGSLPGHGVENVRRPIINTMNLADFIPASTIWTGASMCPNKMYPPNSPALMYCVTTGNSPFRLNLHVNDLGHTLIIGPTGSGKSTLLGQLIMQMPRYKGATIFAFDKGLSLYPLTKGMDGQHFEVAGDDSKLSFAPLQFLETPADRAWAQNWIEDILVLNGQELSPGLRNEILRVLEDMHENGGRTLTDFVGLVQNSMIRTTLQAYTVAGSMGNLLDAETDGLDLGGYLTTFEIEALMNLGEKWLLPVLMYLFRRIERSLKGQPAFIIIDEAWVALSHPVFCEKIKEWLKVLRKLNAAVIMATQSLSDASGTKIFDAIVESTATKIFLPNPFARNDGVKEVYLKMGLNLHQVNIIAGAIPKRQYYLTCANGSRLFDLAIQPLALSFVGVSDRDTVLKIKALEKSYPTEWQSKWLEERGVAISTDKLEHLELDEEIRRER